MTRIGVTGIVSSDKTLGFLRSAIVTGRACSGKDHLVEVPAGDQWQTAFFAQHCP